jgi:hypothetical protein
MIVAQKEKYQHQDKMFMDNGQSMCAKMGIFLHFFFGHKLTIYLKTIYFHVDNTQMFYTHVNSEPTMVILPHNSLNKPFKKNQQCNLYLN